MRELFSILSPTNLTLFFLCFHRKTDYIFDHVANGLSVVCEMLTDGNDCFTKLRRDEPVNLAILGRICDVLNCDYGDLMQYVPEENTND